MEKNTIVVDVKSFTDRNMSVYVDYEVDYEKNIVTMKISHQMLISIPAENFSTILEGFIKKYQLSNIGYVIKAKQEEQLELR